MLLFYLLSVCLSVVRSVYRGACVDIRGQLARAGCFPFAQGVLWAGLRSPRLVLLQVPFLTIRAISLFFDVYPALYEWRGMSEEDVRAHVYFLVVCAHPLSTYIGN